MGQLAGSVSRELDSISGSWVQALCWNAAYLKKKTNPRNSREKNWFHFKEEGFGKGCWGWGGGNKKALHKP